MTFEDDDTRLSEENPVPRKHPPGQFPKTRWSVVLAAGKPDGDAARNELFRMYRASVVGFLWRLGCSRQEAEDKTQGFFTRLLERNDLARVEQREGRRFRSWLCTCVKRYFFNARAHERSAKNFVVQYADEFDETAARQEPNAAWTLDTEATLDRIWDQCWAHEVMQRSLARLREHRHCRGRMALYQELCNPSVRQALNESERMQHEVLLAKEFGIKVNSVRVSRHRLHLAFLECLNTEITLTLDASCSLGEERTRLIQAFSAADSMLAKHSEIPSTFLHFEVPHPGSPSPLFN